MRQILGKPGSTCWSRAEIFLNENRGVRCARTPRSILMPVGFSSGAWCPPLVCYFIPVVAVVLVIEDTKEEKT